MGGLPVGPGEALEALDQNLVPLLSSALALRDVGLCRGAITVFCQGTWAASAAPATGSCTVALFQDGLGDG